MLILGRKGDEKRRWRIVYLQMGLCRQDNDIKGLDLLWRSLSVRVYIFQYQQPYETMLLITFRDMSNLGFHVSGRGF
jgi:hypothetical protein